VSSDRTIEPVACRQLAPATVAFYQQAMSALQEAGVAFLVGGAYSLARYTGIERHTKDFDVFVKREDCDRALAVLEGIGCGTDVPFPHWLGKAYRDGEFVDVIFSSGNGIADVDDLWFAHAVDEVVLGIQTRLCPPEETIWSKSFIMERERYDGADILHLIRACGDRLDWDRLLKRFDGYWRVLLAHLTLFGFVYPGERDRVPARVMRDLMRRLDGELEIPADERRTCRGTILSRSQYLVDIGRWGYRDGRLSDGNMTRGQIARWTAAIDDAG
jgi:hypothetical protein